MVSIGPYSTSLDNTHMQLLTPIENNRSRNIQPGANLYYFVKTSPYFRKLAQLIEIAGWVGQFSQDQLNITLFFPEDKNCNLDFNIIDRGLAQNILNVCSMNNKLDSEIIRSSPVCYYTARDRYRSNQIFVTNISDRTRVNDCAYVVKFDVKLNNAILHVIDRDILPTMCHFLN